MKHWSYMGMSYLHPVLDQAGLRLSEDWCVAPFEARSVSAFCPSATLFPHLDAYAIAKGSLVLRSQQMLGDSGHLTFHSKSTSSLSSSLLLQF
jgi:hypothetical protein